MDLVVFILYPYVINGLKIVFSRDSCVCVCVCGGGGGGGGVNIRSPLFFISIVYEVLQPNVSINYQGSEDYYFCQLI